MVDAAVVIALLMGVVLADALASPRARLFFPLRSLAGICTLLAAASLAFSLALVATGAPHVSAAVVLALTAAVTLISNVKRKVLGEPLVFSDFALISAVFQHPQFYLSALRPGQIAVLGSGVAGLIAALALLSSGELAPRLMGLALGLGAGVALAVMLRFMCWPDLGRELHPDADVLRHGLVASLLAQWRDWRSSPDPEPCNVTPIRGQSRQLVVIVQCESFTDPVALFGDPALALPGLEAARSLAWQQGQLLVSGFGAYTMRTEYGVLFGRGEELLGVRRFDPFLTAHSEVSWALPNRLECSEWNSWFVHPHDMRFYGRDRLMPEAGFAALVGEDRFAPPGPDQGRYVTDEAIANTVLKLAQDRARAALIYAVTIENHGPWPACDEGAPYLNLLAHSDAMLMRLLDELPRLGRPATLCFFGDHRPSIPGAIEPGPERYTPYALVRFASDGTPIMGSGMGQNLTPAELHHAILAAIRLGEAEG